MQQAKKMWIHAIVPHESTDITLSERENGCETAGRNKAMQ
jgi:hypothetical protein